MTYLADGESVFAIRRGLAFARKQSEHIIKDCAVFRWS